MSTFFALAGALVGFRRQHMFVPVWSRTLLHPRLTYLATQTLPAGLAATDRHVFCNTYAAAVARSLSEPTIKDISFGS